MGITVVRVVNDVAVGVIVVTWVVGVMVLTGLSVKIGPIAVLGGIVAAIV
jgi:hypothetical protein